jgi:hypothetical protein
MEGKMPERKLKYFAYISRAKINQLHEQLTDFAAENKSTKRTRDAEPKSGLGSRAFFSALRGNLSLRGRSSNISEEAGTETVVQKLVKVIEHIEAREKVLDLTKLCKKKEGVRLDAFCYSYSGKFFALGEIGREKSDRGISISQASLARIEDDIVISKSLLVLPGREENSLKEIGPNKSKLVSDIAIITSATGEYTISLACSFKYFSDMGGSWDEREKEWRVYPHSGNYHFFARQLDAWFEALVFLTVIRGNAIMGTPLFLAHSVDPSLRL